MEDFKIVIFLMAILISLMAIGNKRKLPYPVLLVVAGLIIGFIPQLPNLALDPDVIFLIILPPLLYDAASKTSWHEFKSSIRPISALAISLVFLTATGVAVAAHYMIPGFSWPLAFVLGAVVSPPDAVAASGIIKGLGLNKKVITIIEGESLVNDASALIAYRYAVAAVSTGSFVFWQAGLQFLFVAAAGIAVGITAGYLVVLAHKKILNNPVVETSLSLLTPFIAYLAAEQFHLSGVLAVVSAGLVISWRSPEVFSYLTRMRTKVVWSTLIFLLHGFVFILIGLQLPQIIKNLGDYPFRQLIGYGLLISLIAILIRIIWVFAGTYWHKLFAKAWPGAVLKDTDDDIWKNVLVVAWTGTRGVISLAAALALPLFLQDGSAFPKRNLIIFLAFIVIFVTLVVQGLSLPLLVKWLKIKTKDTGDEEQKELQLYLASSTLQFIEKDLPVALQEKTLLHLKKELEQLIRVLTKELRRHKKAKRNETAALPLPVDELVSARLEISKFQRGLLLKLHQEGEFSDKVIKQVERAMDIEEMQLNLQVPKEVT
jgi:monovalent cation/hydrogen antiporter